MPTRHWNHGLLLALALVGVLALVSAETAATAMPNPYTYTTTADFELGTLINVVDDADQVQLDNTSSPFNFIWIAVSSKGTAVKIDTLTGNILGEYWTAPQDRPKDPSRTTVDNNGSIWVTNRAESDWVAANAIAPGVPPEDRWMGSVTHIGLVENGQCVDRNSNGVIDTSTGQFDVLAWDNAGGADTLGGVSTAQDECILHFTRVNSSGARHVSVNADNDVWVSGIGGQFFDLVDDDTGQIIRQEPSVGFGGYGGLIDANGVIWSANPMLRWDTALPLTAGNYTGYGHVSYGLCLDSQGNVWNTGYGDGTIKKFNSAGVMIGSYWEGNTYAQGCVVDQNDDVWVAHSLNWGVNTVGHLLNDGTYVGSVTLDPDGNAGPTGVAVDAAGKVWATGYQSGKAYRIDPAANAVDLITVYLDGALYNYSDMTGSTLSAPPNVGSWTIVHDTGVADAEWGYVSWTADVPDDGSLTVTAASSADGITFGPPETVTNGADLSVADGQYLKVMVSFVRGDPSGVSPVLYDLTIEARLNEPPDCSAATPSVGLIWPPNNKFVPVTVLGVTDPDGDELVYTIDSIYQDEPVDSYGDGRFTPDGRGLGTATAEVRAERAGTKKVPGDGRFYHIGFTATDPYGEYCVGTISVVVPHDMSKTPVDQGPLYDSTVP